MENEVNEVEKPSFMNEKKDDSQDSFEAVQSQPLILKQDSKNTKGIKSMPYDFGAETYEVYSNPKNPFMVGILAAETDRIQLDPIKTQSLFEQYEKKSPYTLEFPHSISAHRKRKLSSSLKFSAREADAKTKVSDSKLKSVSSEYLPREKLKEDKRKLQAYMQGFFTQVLKRLGEEPGGLAVIINELVPLFVEHQIRVRFYEAFRQIRSMDDLRITLKKISNDSELENFELFCSALFIFYSSQGG